MTTKTSDDTDIKVAQAQTDLAEARAVHTEAQAHFNEVWAAIAEGDNHTLISAIPEARSAVAAAQEAANRAAARLREAQILAALPPDERPRVVAAQTDLASARIAAEARRLAYANVISQSALMQPGERVERLDETRGAWKQEQQRVADAERTLRTLSTPKE